MKTRVAYLLEASTRFGVVPHADFAEWFIDEVDLASNKKEQFLLNIADTARNSVVDELITKADEIARSSQVPDRSDEKIDAVLEAFKLLTPASSVGISLAFLMPLGRSFIMEICCKDLLRIESAHSMSLCSRALKSSNSKNSRSNPNGSQSGPHS